MITWVLKKWRQYNCSHTRVDTEEYAILGFETYFDERGPYRPFYTGDEKQCTQCGKVWFTNQVGYRFYIDQNGELLEKVECKP